MTTSAPETDVPMDDVRVLDVRGRRRPVRRLAGHVLGDSLYRNSFFLLANLLTSTVVGFGFWVVCARLYSRADVGYATALIGALGLAGSIAGLGLTRTITRFLGTSDNKPQEITTQLALVCAVSVAVALVMSMFLRRFGIHDTGPLTVVVFTVTAVLTSAKTIFDNVFVALQSSSGTLVANVVASAGKVAFPFLAVGLGALGIFGANLAAAAGGVLCAVILLRRRFGLRLRERPAAVVLRGRWQFMVGSYFTDIIGGLPANVLPIIVVTKLGASQGALWYTVALLVNFLLLISSTINQVMFAEMSNTTGGIRRPIAKALFGMYALVAPATAVMVVFAPKFLALFNRSYVEATQILRVMAVFALLGVVNYVGGSIVAYYKKIAFLTFANAANAAVVIGYCYAFAHDLNGILTGWIWGEIVNVALFVGGAIYYTRHLDRTKLVWAR